MYELLPQDSDACVTSRRIIASVRIHALVLVALFVSACTSAKPASPTPQPSASEVTRPSATPTSAPTSTLTPATNDGVRPVRSAGDFPLLSPNGTTLISRSQGGKGGTASSFVFETLDGKLLQRIPDDRAAGQMRWLPDSSGVLVELAAGQRAGPLGIVSVDGKVIETGLEYSDPALSPDGQWIAAEHQEGCCVPRIREIWVAPRSGGAPRKLVTSTTPDDVLQPISLLGWDADGGLVYRDGSAFRRVTLGGVLTQIVAPSSARGRVVIASAVSPDNAVILLCAADPLGWWTIANGTISELPHALRPAWRLRDPYCSRPDEVPWYGAHDLILRDVAGKTRDFDAVSGGDHPMPLIPSDAVLSASTYILMTAIGQDLWVMSGTGGVPTGLRAPAGDVLISPLANSSFFVRIGTAAYVVGMPPDPRSSGLWKDAPELRFPKPAIADNNVRCGLIAGKLTRQGEGFGGTVIAPVTSAAYGVTASALIGLPEDAPRTGSYVCVRALPGAPMSGFGGWVQPGEKDYVPRTGLAPTGFDLPKSCAYAGDPIPDELQFEVIWRIDCGAAGDVRATLAPALTAQGWTLCGAALDVAIWSKDARTLTVTPDASASASPTLRLRPNSDCP